MTDNNVCIPCLADGYFLHCDRQVSPTAPGLSSTGNTPHLRVLRCLIHGEFTAFKVTLPLDNDVSDLKDIIHNKGVNVRKDVLAKDLLLWKVSISYPHSRAEFVAYSAIY